MLVMSPENPEVLNFLPVASGSMIVLVLERPLEVFKTPVITSVSATGVRAFK